ELKNEKMIERYKFDLDIFYQEMKHHFILKSDEEEFKNELFDYFEKKNIAVKFRKKEDQIIKRKGLLELIDNKIKITDKFMKWEDAITEISQVLIDNGDIDEKYTEEIINLINEKGPYFIITPKVALVHSKPSENVKNTSIGLLVSKKDIIFENSKKVNIIIMLTLADRKSHLSALADILTIFENKLSVKDLINKENSIEIIEYIRNNLDFSKEKRID
ncbi:PTS sugar transporter subunit IIA, partial [Clostridiaceae bacterium HSG29]|nr:PTS sugar transporter subunit IIA [Clostridiaceae bacterium HSG29]